jgi:hypothetical protein
LWWRRARWFLLIWSLSVATVALIASALRAVLRLTLQ